MKEAQEARGGHTEFLMKGQYLSPFIAQMAVAVAVVQEVLTRGPQVPAALARRGLAGRVEILAAVPEGMEAKDGFNV